MSKNNVTVAEGFRKDNMLSRSKKRLIFYILMFALPLLQFALFYIYVNVNTITLAFTRYDQNLEGLGYTVHFVGFENISKAWRFFASSGPMIMSSLKLYICNLVIVMGLALIFSYYIAKKFMLAGFFRVVLYLPQVVSSVVLVLLYKYIVGDVFAIVGEKLFGEEFMEANGLSEGLLGGNASASVKYGVVLFYNLWIGFGANVMLFTGSMSSIDQSIIESAGLDGVNIVQEFIHIYIPMIFPTFTTFVVTGITGIFTNQMNMYTFFGNAGLADFDVFGYYLYRNTVKGDVYSKTAKGLSYPEIAALGVIITLILVPITLLVRKLMETYGPRTD